MQEITATSLRLECVDKPEPVLLHSFASPHPISVIEQKPKPIYRVWMNGNEMPGIWLGKIDLVVTDQADVQKMKVSVELQAMDVPLKGPWPKKMRVLVECEEATGSYQAGYWNFGPKPAPKFTPFEFPKYQLAVGVVPEMDEMLADADATKLGGIEQDLIAQIAAAQQQMKEQLMMAVFNEEMADPKTPMASGVIMFGGPMTSKDWNSDGIEEIDEEDEELFELSVTRKHTILPAREKPRTKAKPELGGPRLVTLED